MCDAEREKEVADFSLVHQTAWNVSKQRVSSFNDELDWHGVCQVSYPTWINMSTLKVQLYTITSSQVWLISTIYKVYIYLYI